MATGALKHSPAWRLGLILVAVGRRNLCTLSGTSLRSAAPPALFAIWPVLASVVVKSVLAVWKFRVGKRTGSAGLTADGKHDLVDLLSSGVALTAVLLTDLRSRADAQAADHYGGMIIGVVVIFMGVEVIRETVLQLSDVMPDAMQMEQMRQDRAERSGRAGGGEMFCAQDRASLSCRPAPGSGSEHDRARFARDLRIG